VRNLTIQRGKTAVGALAKAKVYIEDLSGDLVISGVRCRKLGEIKNGQEATFYIGNTAAKIFVISDKLSRNFCNDFYALPEGGEDVVLTGSCKFNPFLGNAFRFDNNDSFEVYQNRKQGKKKGVVIMAAAILVGLAVGWLLGGSIFHKSSPGPTTFSVKGMSITLPGEFVETHDGRFTACYTSEEAGVFALKEPFTLLEGSENKTPFQYGHMVIETNGLHASSIKKENDLVYFTYESPDGTVFYMAFLYKTEDAFWMVQCATNVEDAEKMTPRFKAWAASVKFD